MGFFFFFQFWRLGGRVWSVCSSRVQSSFSHGRRVTRLLWWATNLIQLRFASWPNHFHKDLPLNTITFRCGVSTWEFGETTTQWRSVYSSVPCGGLSIPCWESNTYCAPQVDLFVYISSRAEKLLTAGPKPDSLHPREGPHSIDADQIHAKEELSSAMSINFSNAFQAFWHKATSQEVRNPFYSFQYSPSMS